MQVSIENTSNLGRRVTVDVPGDRVNTEEASKLKNLSKTVKIDGFRPGKVPEKLIQERFGPQVRQEAVGKLVESTLPEVLKQENLTPASQPVVEEVKDDKGSDLQYIFTVEVLPEIELKDFSELKLTKKTADITEEDVDKGILRLQEQFGDWKEVQRDVKDGDKVSIDFEGLMDGKPFEHGSGQDVSLEIGSGQFIPGFESGLEGAKIAEQVTLNLEFPKEYGAKDLAGKPVQFNVTVQKVFEKDLAPQDEEFAKKIGLEDGDTNKIREKIKSNLEKFLEDIVGRQLRDAALDKLFEVHPIDVPDSVVEREKKGILEDAARRQVQWNDDEVHEEAKKRAALGLLINKVIQQFEIKPDADRIKAKVQELSAMFGNTDFVQDMYLKSPELLQSIQSSVLADQATDFIVEKATIETETSTFYDIADGSF